MKLLNLLLLLILTTMAFAQTRDLPDNFANIPVVEADLFLPTNIVFDKNGQGYICEKRGVVRILDTLGNLLPEPLIDISEEIVSSDDHGLTGIALHPDFLQNGYFYLLYSVDRHHLLHFGTTEYDPNISIEKQPTIARLTRFKADSNSNFQNTIPNERLVLMGKNIQDRSLPILMTSHGIGDLEFGESGNLFVSFGDGGSYQFADAGSSPDTYFEQALEDGILLEKENVGSFRAQLVDNMGGKILRLDPKTGEGISDNPFFDSSAPNSPRSKIYALGFRNPFRFFTTVDSNGEDILFVGDVGSGLWEELNIVSEPGQNFGWPMHEGMQRRWQHANLLTQNLDAKNPLFDGADCDSEFLKFTDLFLNEQRNHNYFFKNPCNVTSEIPADVLTFYHTHPFLAISNLAWNPPTKTEVRSWSPEGNPIGVSIDEAGITGEIFDGFSLMAGFRYQADNFPPEYQGKIFFTDYSGWIRTATVDENFQLKSVDLFMNRDTGIVDIKVNPKDGCLYYVHINSSSIHKVCYGGTPPPVVEIATDVIFGASPLRVQFDGGDSFSPSGVPLDFEWDFDDGLSSNEVAPIHIFEADSTMPQSFEVQLTVSDSIGNVRSKKVLISVNNTPPQAKITSLSEGDFYPVSDISYLKLEAEVTDNEHVAGEMQYNWQTFLQHNVHFHEEPLQTEPIGFLLLDPSNCSTTETFWYRVKLTVEDGHGLTSSDEVEIFPLCEDAFFEIPDLKVQILKNSVVLTWAPTFENGVKHFEIQRTEDYRFDSIAVVEAGGNSSYVFEDKNPINGTNLYRLKVVRNDGTYEYSPKVKIAFPAAPTSVLIAPNPTYGKFQLIVENVVEEEIQFQLFDLLGSLVLEEKYSTHLGEPFQFGKPYVFDINFDAKSNGMYIYKLKNGDESVTGKIMIH